MRQVLLLALNDVRLTVRDRPALFWLFVLPIAMMWFFGNVGGGSSGGEPRRARLTVVNKDTGWLGSAFVSGLADDRLELVEMTAAEAAAREDRVHTLIIPAGFTDQVLAGQQQTLRLERDPGSSRQFSVAVEVRLVRVIARTLGRLVEVADGGQSAEAFRQLAGREPLVTVDDTTAGVGRPVPAGFSQSVPGMLTFLVLMMTLIYGAVFTTLEKRTGMLRRQAALPVGRLSLFLGKLAGRLFIAGGQILVLVLAGRFVFGVSWGSSPGGLVLMLVSYAVAVAGLATLLGAWVRSPEQASAVGWILSMILAALGGCWWPSEVMPPWLWRVAHVLPTAWAMDGFHGLISFGRGIDGVWVPALVLLGFGALFSLLGARFLRYD